MVTPYTTLRGKRLFKENLPEIAQKMFDWFHTNGLKTNFKQTSNNTNACLENKYFTEQLYNNKLDTSEI